MIQTRDDLDLDWDAVFAAAAATGTALEMNGSHHRLDLSVERARRARSCGCILSIDSDAHRTEEFDVPRLGRLQARRAWVTPDRVLNTQIPLGPARLGGGQGAAAGDGVDGPITGDDARPGLVKCPSWRRAAYRRDRRGRRPGVAPWRDRAG